MNEPHQVTREADLGRVAEFDSFATRTIVNNRSATRSRPLISVNASFVFPDDGAPPGASDMDVWRDRSDLSNYGDVDLVSYHGLTARGAASYPACGGVTVPRVDPVAIDERADLHLSNHPDKALMYSTDAVAVKGFEHTYRGGIGMNVRDGQILPVPEGDTLEAQHLRSHVYSWAKWCFERGRGNDLGRIHFHNHSTFRLQLQRIAEAARAAGLQPATAEEPAERLIRV